MLGRKMAVETPHNARKAPLLHAFAEQDSNFGVMAWFAGHPRRYSAHASGQSCLKSDAGLEGSTAC